ncbi:NF-kappa-B inhibitor cactus [Copidosoma floridanum]|uniref:NF-kappa-B inhibitor cactus n=1 Tax=Copidosoma floridanum TaxID=29053 RepID=UPI0006C9E07A|nr:NF-kappa-B inhibitor cactus [Copidosoma floridanum]XP_014219129.1 NF-kappa-B inhibitor cactus [Copidosoma floridanum]XP_014219130.1 NF-kappa-B inhibitor cactus [Copidosoma floridanum]
MWRQPTYNDQMDGAASKDKQIEDSQGDSGFISSGNLLSSQLSIDSEEEELNRDDAKVAPEPVDATKSGLDLGLDIDLNKLSLKDVATSNQSDSGIINIESEDLISGELQNFKVDDEFELLKNVNVPQWQLYYAQDNDGDTQLHLSIIQEFTEAINYLIDIAPHPCLLDLQNDNWDSALHLAVLTKQGNIVRKLILSGADPMVRNFQGNTPLHLACDRGSLSCVKALTCPLTQFEKSTLGDKLPASIPQNLQMRNYNGLMCIHLATKKGHTDVIRHLTSVGADVNGFEGLAGYTALHLAISRGSRETALFLVRECRAKLDSKTYAGRTAYGLARRSDPKLAADLLRLGTKSSQPLDLSSDNEMEEDEEDEDGDVEARDEYREVMKKLNVSSPLVM